MQNLEKTEENIPETILVLSKPVEFEGKKYTEIDLSGLNDLTTKQLKQARRLMNAQGASLDIFADRSIEYATYIASIVTNRPIELFDALPAKDGMNLKNMVIDFLY